MNPKNISWNNIGLMVGISVGILITIWNCIYHLKDNTLSIIQRNMFFYSNDNNYNWSKCYLSNIQDYFQCFNSFEDTLSSCTFKENGYSLYCPSGPILFFRKNIPIFLSLSLLNDALLSKPLDFDKISYYNYLVGNINKTPFVDIGNQALISNKAIIRFYVTSENKPSKAWAISDPHFFPIIDKPGKKRKKQYYTPKFPLSKKEEKNIFNIISDCNYFVNAKIFETNHHHQQQWINSIYIGFENSWKITFNTLYFDRNFNQYYFKLNNKKIINHDNKITYMINNNNNMNITFDHHKGNMIISKWLYHFNTKIKYHQKTNTTYLDFHFHAESGWKSHNIQGILGASGNQNYIKCPFYFPGTIEDYRIAMPKNKNNMDPFNFHHKYNRYMNCTYSYLDYNEKICPKNNKYIIEKDKYLNGSIIFTSILDYT